MKSKHHQTTEDRQPAQVLMPPEHAAGVPVTFRLGGRRIEGFPRLWHAVAAMQTLQDGSERTVYTGSYEGLRLRVECTVYPDFPVVEWIAFLQNESDRESELISDFCIEPPCFEGTSPRLRRASGDSSEWEESYRTSCEPLAESLSLSPFGGQPCNGEAPYMRLLFKEYGVNIAVGWPAQWQADFIPAGAGVFLSVRQQRLYTRLLPGESLRTPRLTCMTFTGGELHGMNLWRRWYFRYLLPRPLGEPQGPKLILMDDGGGIECTATSEAQQLEAIRTYINAGLTPDIWWLDAGWYACPGFQPGETDWQRLGNTYPDPVRFPNGLGPVGDLCAAHSTDFLLWFEPQRVCKGTKTQLEHPEWVMERTGEHWRAQRQVTRLPARKVLCETCILKLWDDACCDWLIETIDKLIKESGVRIYREDNNFNPLLYWIDYETPERIGALENRHVVNLLRYWDALTERNPGLWIDTCSSGGRHNDLESIRRAVPLHYSDLNGRPAFAQAQYDYLFRWTPYFRGAPQTMREVAGTHTSHYDYYAALAPAIAMNRIGGQPEELALLREMEPIWRRAAELMLSGDFYPLTPCRINEADDYAVQFDDPDAGRGFILFLRNAEAAADSFTVCPVLDEGSVYRFESSETGELFEMDGLAARNGMTRILEKRAGEILFYNRA